MFRYNIRHRNGVCLIISTCMMAFFSATIECQAAPAKSHAAPATRKPTARKPTARKPTARKLVMMSYSYVLDVGPAPYAYSVRLNGWPIDDSPGDKNTRFSSTRIGLYLVEGRNTVSIHIGPPPKGIPPGHKFDVTVRDVQGTVEDYHWNPAKPHIPIPVQAEIHFNAHLPHGPWAWQSAPEITLDAPTKTAINAQVKRFFDALNTKNVAEADALFALRNRDDAATSSVSDTEALAAAHAGWVTTFADPHWRMEPIDYAHLRYTLVADGRAALVQRADGSDVLRTAAANSDGLFTSYDVYLSLIHGQWTLVR